ncbi:uncharacterized protein [Anabrus simplex]|uniref:uncharacterized protein n=1 Tax=Anabrus simplex TaxID=316456 RepID=UPI0035A2FD85
MWFCCQLWKCKLKTCFTPLDVWKAWNGWSHVVYPSKADSAPNTFLDPRVGEERGKCSLFPHRQGLSRSQDSPTAAFPHIEPEVNVEHIVDYYVDDAASVASDTDNESLKLQYRQIWELRATLEEDEGLSDPDRLPAKMVDGDTTESCDQSPEQKTASYQTEESESSTRHFLEEPNEWPLHLQELPSYEARRQTYRSILAWRARRLEVQKQLFETPVQTSADHLSLDYTKFDTIDTLDLEESSTEPTVPEQISGTSEARGELTTSPGEGQGHRLQQLRADSGYKSLENPPGSASRFSSQQLTLGESTDIDGLTTSPYPPISNSRELYVEDSQEVGISRMKRNGLKLVSLGDSGTCDADLPAKSTNKDSQHRCIALGSSNERDHDEGVEEMQSPPATDSPVVEERRKSCDRTASKKRREFVSGRGAMPLIYPDVEYHHRYSSIHSYSRDYSVDEKSDALFREFSRYDPGQTEVHARQRLGGSGYRRHHSRHSHYPSYPYPEPARSFSEHHSSIDEEYSLPRSLELRYTFDDPQSAPVPIIRVADED